MKDLRLEKLAENLLTYSCELKEGESILIEQRGEDSQPLVKELVKKAYKLGAKPFVNIVNHELLRLAIENSNQEQFEQLAQYSVNQMKDMDAYIAIASYSNLSELSNVNSTQMNLYQKYYIDPVHMKERVNNTKWCILVYPNNSLAQKNNSSLEEFEDFYFNVCCFDYEKMSRKMENLVELMSRTDKVRIVGPQTDISFSIKDIPVVKACGRRNIPDGEVYTAPVKNSVNGVISYNVPSKHNGCIIENIKLSVKEGRIIEATANDNEKINKFLDIDEGARYFGEFAIGLHPYITKPMVDTLFDEKICGSFHLTPGCCYNKASNGNISIEHWDLICIQTPEYGGGEIWFDDILIRKDGRFVLPELECLNPENLK